MKPELKFGRACIAWEDGVDPIKGRYLIYQSHGQAHWILCYDGTITPFKHAEPDLNADPMNGDEVEVSDDKVKWHKAFYYGKTKNQRHLAGSICGVLLECKYVRFPQPSKRDRVIETLKAHEEIVTANIVTRSSLEKLADEILKITEDEE